MLPKSSKEESDTQKFGFNPKKIPKDELPHAIRELNAKMNLASSELRFEDAAELRDLIESLQKQQ